MAILEERHQIRQIVTRVDLMNIAYNKSTLVNNSFSNSEMKNEDKICNALGCPLLATNEISLKIGEKSIKIFVCESCKPKFEK
jgi:hypothetical protein